MKVCKCCGIIKQEEEFYVHSEMTSGRLNKCKECVKKQVRKYVRENADILSEREKKRYQRRRRDPMFRQKRADYLRQWRTPETMQAHNATARKLTNSKPEIYEKCKIRPAQMAHHPDYSKPNKVNWICYRCHSLFRTNLQTLGG